MKAHLRAKLMPPFNHRPPAQQVIGMNRCAKPESPWPSLPTSPSLFRPGRHPARASRLIKRLAKSLHYVKDPCLPDCYPASPCVCLGIRPTSSSRPGEWSSRISDKQWHVNLVFLCRPSSCFPCWRLIVGSVLTTNAFVPRKAIIYHQRPTRLILGAIPRSCPLFLLVMALREISAQSSAERTLARLIYLAALESVLNQFAQLIASPSHTLIQRLSDTMQSACIIVVVRRMSTFPTRLLSHP